MPSSRPTQRKHTLEWSLAALILTCTPIFPPIAKDLGMDPVQFGSMLLINLGIGLCTPSVGACTFGWQGAD